MAIAPDIEERGTGLLAAMTVCVLLFYPATRGVRLENVAFVH